MTNIHSLTAILAGNATFTIHNDKGTHFTYRVKHAGRGNSLDRTSPLFVSVLTGPCNETAYTYMGIVTKDGQVKFTYASHHHFKEDSLSVRVLRHFLFLLRNGGFIPEGYGIHHEGRCLRCGRKLTTPESVSRGLGPECASM